MFANGVKHHQPKSIYLVHLSHEMTAFGLVQTHLLSEIA
jgi:hypothetical protein